MGTEPVEDLESLLARRIPSGILRNGIPER